MNSSSRISGTELRKSLNLVIVAICFGIAFFVVVNGYPLTGFTRKLGAGDLVYGIIMAMPVIGGVLQVFTSYFLESTGRRKPIFLIAGFIHRLLWIPIAVIPLIIPMNYKILTIWSVTTLITISAAANSVVGVTFLSWMGALVPLSIRGRYFSKRTAISTIIGALSGIAVGRFLDMVPGINGFSIIFILAALFGAVDIFCFIWIKDPPIPIPQQKQSFIRLFTEPFGNRNYVKYIVFISLWNFGLNIAGPFFTVFMLEYLKMNFLTLSIFGQVMSNISTVIFVRLWGKLADRYGNKPVMVICGSVIFTLPFLWLFATPSNYVIVLVINFLSGMFWSGFDMTNVNMSIWLAPVKNRSIFLANYTLVTSVLGVALAYVCGGIFLEVVKPFMTHLKLPFVMGQRLNGFHLLFIFSGLIRLVALLLLLPGVNEENSRTAGDTVKEVMNSLKASISKGFSNLRF